MFMSNYYRKSGLFELQFSKFRLESKPSDFVKATQQWNQYMIFHVSVEEMAEYIGQGRAWRNAVYEKDGRSFRKKNAIGSQFIVLDFDSCAFAPQDVVNRAMELGITPNMWYYSFSQGIKEGYNFRVIWILDKVIDGAQFDSTLDWFYRGFDKFGPDKNTKDISRMWYPGKKGVEVIDVGLLVWDSLGIKVECVKEDEVSFLDNVGSANPVEALEVVDWEKQMYELCDLWRKAVNGVYLYRKQRLVLVSNLRLIKGSFSRVFEVFSNGLYEESQLSQIAVWYNDDKLMPARILRKSSKDYSVADLFADSLF